MAADHRDLLTTERLLREQWVLLRDWLDDLDDAAMDQPSVLDGWTVRELVAHLSRAMAALTKAQPAPAGTIPLSLGEYLGTYPERAQEIADTTREIAREIGDDPLPALDRTAEDTFAQLTTLRDLAPDPVVQARRGPILLSEMVVSRLIELVVHADDLARSVPGLAKNPVHSEALGAVSEALLEIVVDRGGHSLEVNEPLLWTRLACGRQPYDVDELARALQHRHTAEAVPDLGRMLPLL